MRARLFLLIAGFLLGATSLLGAVPSGGTARASPRTRVWALIGPPADVEQWGPSATGQAGSLEDLGPTEPLEHAHWKADVRNTYLRSFVGSILGNSPTAKAVRDRRTHGLSTLEAASAVAKIPDVAFGFKIAPEIVDAIMPRFTARGVTLDQLLSGAARAATYRRILHFRGSAPVSIQYIPGPRIAMTKHDGIYDFKAVGPPQSRLRTITLRIRRVGRVTESGIRKESTK